MQRTEMRRRRLLQASGAALAMAVAGCTSDLPGMGDNGDDGDGTPTYADWVGTIEDDGKEGAGVAYVNLTALAEFDDDESEDGGEDGGEDDGSDIEDIGDPLIGIALTGGFSALLGGTFALMEVGISDLVDVDADGGYETSIEDLILAGETVVMTGSVDVEEIDAELTAEPENLFWGTQFERTDEFSGYDLYQPVQGEGSGGVWGEGGEDDDEITTIAVGDGAIVVDSGLERVEAAIETGEGDGTRAVDEFDGFNRLLEVAGHGHMVMAGYSPDGLDEEVEEPAEDDLVDPGEEEGDWFEDVDGANGYAGSITMSETEAEAKLAIDFEELDEAQRETLEERLGSEATESATIDFDGNFVTASATYAEEDVGDVEADEEI